MVDKDLAPGKIFKKDGIAYKVKKDSSTDQVPGSCFCCSLVGEECKELRKKGEIPFCSGEKRKDGLYCYFERIVADLIY